MVIVIPPEKAIELPVTVLLVAPVNVTLPVPNEQDVLFTIFPLIVIGQLAELEKVPDTVRFPKVLVPVALDTSNVPFETVAVPETERLIAPIAELLVEVNDEAVTVAVADPVIIPPVNERLPKEGTLVVLLNESVPPLTLVVVELRTILPPKVAVPEVVNDEIL